MVGVIASTTHNICTFHNVTKINVREAGYLSVYLKYLRHDNLKSKVKDGVAILAAASDIMHEPDANIKESIKYVEYMNQCIDTAIKTGACDGWLAFEIGKGMDLLYQVLLGETDEKKTYTYTFVLL